MLTSGTLLKRSHLTLADCPKAPPGSASLAAVESLENRILVLTPGGRDAEVVEPVLTNASLQVDLCHDMDKLCEKMQEGAGAALISEEGLTPPQQEILAEVLSLQPAWSDLPVVVVLSEKSRSHAALSGLQRLEPLYNFYVIERPTSRLVLVKTLQAALRARRRQYEIRDYVQEKDVLLKEIHHRVKNNLQVIISLLNLQAEYVRDATALAVLMESQHRIHSMAMVHENLYSADDLAHVDMAMYLRNLVKHLVESSASLQPPRLNLDIASTAFSVNLAIPCGLILNELISNVFNTPFPTAGWAPSP